MNVTLIPLFLIASIGINENDWKYGPEVIYDVNVASEAYPFGLWAKISSMSNQTMRLYCREKSIMVMSCYFRESETRRASSDALYNEKAQIYKNARKQREFFDEDIFELHYESNGLEKIIVNPSISAAKIDMIKTLVSQLNVGGDLSIAKSDQFEIMENFYTGSCKAKFIVSGRSANADEVDEENKSKNDRPEISILSGNKIPVGDITIIEKTRNLNDCRYWVYYCIGRRERCEESDTFDARIESSKSQMNIGRRNFTSWTENSYIVSSKLLSSSITLKEMITLSLNKIIPATGPLPTIKDGLTVEIFLTGQRF